MSLHRKIPNVDGRGAKGLHATRGGGMTGKLKAPFPWFGGKSRAASLVWAGLGDVRNYVEPFFGSGAVMLNRPTEQRIETVNDLCCVAPGTRVLRADMSWCGAGAVRVGDRLLGFDEHNGPARGGLRAPTRYRRFAIATVTGVRRITKPRFRLTFDDGTTVVASGDHLWLGGSHASGGRGWRWVKTENMVCDRKTQRSWVLKACDVVDREESFDAGWLSGLFDGEGCLHVGPGLHLSIAQNEGPVLERASQLLRERGFAATTTGSRRCKSLQVTGGKHEQLSLLMRLRPGRLIHKLAERCGDISLYGRSHRAIGLVKKEPLGPGDVMAIETDTHTFIAEGLASHNCYVSNFWRAIALDPAAVAAAADWPVNEADLHARHRWLVDQTSFRERMHVEPDFFDAKIAGWWAWGLSCWIGGGWCATEPLENGEVPSEQAKRAQLVTERGVHKVSVAHERRRPSLGGGGHGTGVHQKRPALNGHGSGAGVHGGAGGPSARRRPNMGGAGGGQGVQSPTVTREETGLVEWFQALAARVRRVRVCCGDWKRVLTPAVLNSHGGPTGIVLDPPYDQDERAGNLYSQESLGVSAEVRAWAIEHGEDPSLRIVLCGYEGEHEMPASWRVAEWHTSGGYASAERGVENRFRERLWFSPACLSPDQKELFA